MRIAIWHNLPSGGGKRALYHHVRGLVERGHVVEAWCPPTADQTYLPLRDLVPEHIIPLDWRPVPERHRAARIMAPYRNVVTKLEAMDRHCRRCAEEIDRGGHDVLFANSCTLFRVTSIGRHVSIPKVLYLQEPYRWLYEAMPELPWLALPEPAGGRWSVRHLKRFVQDLINVQGLRVQAREELVNARAFDAILANSLFSRESILRAFGIDAKVCYLGVDTTLFVNLRGPREAVVVGLGSIVPEKRLEIAIFAVAELPPPRPALVWIANVASPSHLEKIQGLARDRGVHFEAKIGVADTDLVDILNRVCALVYTPRLEPFGLAPLEANACGLPVVAVAEGGVRETVIDGFNGLLVEDDPKAVARGIQRLLEDPAYAARLGENGCEFVARQWSIKASIDRLEEKLTQITNPQAPA